MKFPTPTQKKAYDAKVRALRAVLAGNNVPDPQSLSNSYGLPVADVEYHIRSMANGI